MSNYIPHSAEETKEMLDLIGVKSIDDLYGFDNKGCKKVDIGEGKTQAQVEKFFQNLSSENTVFKSILRGAGAYNHYAPAAVRHMASREEFLTAYTPYQPEMNQGELQAGFEYQSMICELTGMDVSNASVYDGGTAVADAIVMSLGRKQNKVLISECVEPSSIEIAKTYLKHSGVEFVMIPRDGYKTDVSKIKGLLDESVGAIVMQQPNRFGTIEDCEAVGKMVEGTKTQFVMSCNPISLAILKTPKECGASIALGEGQALGLPLGAGGPYLGFLSTIEANMRKIPGRIIGQSTDHDGRRAFVLTLQAREQHIRREKASSSICSNQALCALRASMFMTAYGKEGLKTVANVSVSNAHYLADELKKIGLTVKNNGEFFHEFVTDGKGKADAILSNLEKNGILGGLKICDDAILWCATDVLCKCDLDKAVKIIKEVL